MSARPANNNALIVAILFLSIVVLGHVAVSSSNGKECTLARQNRLVRQVSTIVNTRQIQGNEQHLDAEEEIEEADEEVEVDTDDDPGPDSQDYGLQSDGTFQLPKGTAQTSQSQPRRKLPYYPDDAPSVSRCGFNNRPMLKWYRPKDFNSSATPEKLQPTPTSPILLYGCGHSGNTNGSGPPLAKVCAGTTFTFSALSRHPDIHGYCGNPESKETLLRKPDFYPGKKHDKRHFLSHVAEEHGKQRWLIKAPKYVCQIKYILKNIPDAR